MTQVGHCNGCLEYEFTLSEAVPASYPGIGLPAYLIKPIRDKLSRLHPDCELVRVTPSSWDKVVVLLRSSPPVRVAYRPPAQVQNPRLPHTVVWRNEVVAEVVASNGYHYVLPLSEVGPRLLAQHSQRSRG